MTKVTRNAHAEHCVNNDCVKFNDEYNKSHGVIKRVHYDKAGKALGIIINWKKYYII